MIDLRPRDQNVWDWEQYLMRPRPRPRPITVRPRPRPRCSRDCNIPAFNRATRQHWVNTHFSSNFSIPISQELISHNPGILWPKTVRGPVILGSGIAIPGLNVTKIKSLTTLYVTYIHTQSHQFPTSSFSIFALTDRQTQNNISLYSTSGTQVIKHF